MASGATARKSAGDARGARIIGGRSAESLGRAEALGEATREVTEAGARRVGEAVVAVRQIETQSEEFRQIIAVIESIAFQINLLALNASVEAARAGEQAAGVEEINHSIAHLDTLSQENAATTERNASAAFALADKSREFDALLSTFRMAGRAPAPSPTAGRSGVARAMRMTG